MPKFIIVVGCQKAATTVTATSIIMRSGLSAKPIDSILIPAASALARV